MALEVWKAEVEGREHIISLRLNEAWGTIKVDVDGNVVKRGLLTLARVRLDVGGKPAMLKGSGFGTIKWELYVDGRRITRGS